MRKRVRTKLTYANVVSTLAIFGMLATGGAIAATQIGTRQIKDGAVTARKLHNSAVTPAKIRNAAVTGDKVADHSLTGAKIVVSTLGAVPRAGHAASADRATVAGRAVNANHAANSSALGGLAVSAFERSGHLVPISARMSNKAPDRTILTAGPFKVTGHCAVANPQQNIIGAVARTTENDSAIYGHNFQDIALGNTDFDVGMTPQLSLYQESGTPPSPAGPFPTVWFMASPSGVQVALTLTLATRVFSDNASQRVACVFGGFAVVT